MVNEVLIDFDKVREKLQEAESEGFESATFVHNLIFKSIINKCDPKARRCCNCHGEIPSGIPYHIVEGKPYHINCGKV